MDAKEAAGVAGAILAGGSTLLGKPIAITWPEGMPPGWTEESLATFGALLAQAQGSPQQWVLLGDSEHCLALVPCGRALHNGKCDLHG